MFDPIAKGKSKGIKSSLRKFRIAGIGIASILIVQMLFPFVPIPNTYAIPPQPANQPIIATKAYTSNQLGTQVSNAITFRAELNGTATFSRNDVESFRIFLPSGLDGTTTLLKNETYAIVDISSGGFYIQEKWKLNALQFKMQLCWNLPSATSVKLPLSRVDMLTNNVFLINGLDFDWRDAAQAGFSPAYNNQTKEIEVSVPATGCLDPSVGQSSVSPNNAILSQRNVQSFGNAWYVFYTDTSNYVLKCSYAGGAFGAATTIRALSSNTFMMNTEKNSTHIYIHTGINGGVWEKRVLTPTSTCGTTLDTASTILNTGRMGGGNIIQNSTGFLHTVGYDSADSGIALAISNSPYARGNLWTNKGIAIAHNAGYSRLGIINLTNSKFLIYDFYSGDSSTNAHLKVRIFDASTNSYDASVTTLEASLQKSDNNGDCIGSSSQNKAYCAVLLSDGRLKLWRFDGSSWTSEIVAYPSTNAAVGIVRNNADDTLVLFRTINGENMMKWNKTNSAGSSFVSNGQFFVGVQTSPQMMSTSVKPNGTGYVGIAWVNGSSAPFNIHFTTFQAFPPSVPVWGTDIAVANTTSREVEPHIAASPVSNRLVSVFLKHLTGSGLTGQRCQANATIDGGTRWNYSSQMSNASLSFWFHVDPTIAVKSSGEFTMSCLERSLDGIDRLFVSSSQDGISWTSPNIVATGTTITALDKPWIAIDANRTKSSQYAGNVYACWNVNKGSSWSAIIFKRFSPNPTAEKVLFNITGGAGQIGCNMAIGTKGEIYVTWLNRLNATHARIEFRWNELGGEDWGWGRNQTITTIRRFFTYATCDNANNCLKGSGTSRFKAGNDPGIAIDMLGGVHIVYAVNMTSSGADINYTNSDDCKRGSKVDRCSWSAPITISINANGTTNSRDQWEPAIHVSNMTSASKPRGTVHITALDKRDDPSNIQWKVWHYSCVPGSTLGCRSASDWSNQIVSDAAIDNQLQSFIGDYHGITNIGTKEAYTVWADSRKFGSPDNLNFDVMGDWTPR